VLGSTVLEVVGELVLLGSVVTVDVVLVLPLAPP
jgi:hypothetical protein